MNHTGTQKIARNAYDWLADIFSPSNLDTEEISRRTLAGVAGVFSCPFLFGYFFFHLYSGRFLLAGILFFSGMLILTSILLARKKADAKIFYRLVLAAIGLLFFYLMGTSEDYPRAMFWSFIFPIVSLYLLGRKEGLLYTIIYYLIAMIFVLTQSSGMVPGRYSIRFKLDYLFSLLIVSLMSYCFEVVRFHYQKATKRRQASLESANQQLSQEIVKRKMMEQAARDALLELKETQSQLIQSAKLASIGELASGVAHELNQPLMVIRTNVQLLTRAFKKILELSEDRLQSLALIEANTKRMMNIINHLRTFSRQAKEEFAHVDVNKTIEDCILMVGEQLRLRNIHLKLVLMEHLPKVMGNANQLEQVFLNLVTNARDAVEEKMRNDPDSDFQGTIEVITRGRGTPGRFIEMLITDKGGGISDEHVDRIFDPFFTTKDVGMGTGLGLSISYGIIKDHGGEIEMAETGPAGTTFRIRLPISKKK